MVKNIDLEAPKSPHHNFLFLLLNFLQVDDLDALIASTS